MADLKTNDFMFHQQNTPPVNRISNYYTLLGEHDFLDTDNKPRSNEENNAVCGISLNGKTILLNNVYGKDGKMEKGVSVSYLLRTGDFSFPKPLQILNFKNKSEFSEYTLAPNGKVLLMTTEMKDSYGGKDIYVSFLRTDDKWTEPKNIGNKVKNKKVFYKN
jgi:hypothetical protein